jgi:hypothetical protein
MKEATYAVLLLPRMKIELTSGVRGCLMLLVCHEVPEAADNKLRQTSAESKRCTTPKTFLLTAINNIYYIILVVAN